MRKFSFQSFSCQSWQVSSQNICEKKSKQKTKKQWPNETSPTDITIKPSLCVSLSVLCNSEVFPQPWLRQQQQDIVIQTDCHFDCVFNFVRKNQYQKEAAQYLTESAVWTVLEKHMFYKTKFKKTTFNETCWNWCEKGIRKVTKGGRMGKITLIPNTEHTKLTLLRLVFGYFGNYNFTVPLSHRKKEK